MNLKQQWTGDGGGLERRQDGRTRPRPKQITGRLVRELSPVDLNHVSKAHRIEDTAMFVLNVDAGPLELFGPKPLFCPAVQVHSKLQLDVSASQAC